MAARISTLEVRQRIGDLLNRVALRNDEFIIERKGKPLAALVNPERLEQMRRLARLQALETMSAQRSADAGQKKSMQLANESKRWARQRRAKKSLRSRTV